MSAREETLGREIVAGHQLEVLRNRLGLTRTAMAELLHTSPITYGTWEKNPAVNLWPATAARIGRFYHNATEELRYVEKTLRISMTDLVPLYIASTQLGIPQELLLRRYRQDEFEAVDLGMLGLWVHRAVLATLQDRR